MILILTDGRHDGHAEWVVTKLRHRGADPVVFDYGLFPSQAQISLSYAAKGGVRFVMRTGRETIELNNSKAVWLRRPTAPVAHEEIKDDMIRRAVQTDCRSFLQDLCDSLHCLWVPAPPAVVSRTQLKVSQLKLAGELGFEVPPTLITNCPEDFLEFYRQHNGNIVSKLAGLSSLQIVDNSFCRYTEVVSKRDAGYAHSVRYCPIIFQAYVPKRFELRITVVGQQVFAAEIHSQHTNHTRHDWRRYDLDETPYFSHELPPDVAQRCIQLVQELGLCYGAIDMVLTPDDRYVFLEINPSGQYLWIEQLTGLPITDALCDLLMAGAQDGTRRSVSSASPSGGLL
jgi:MvdD-like protein with pre-ATP grasp domain/ribosomal protein S6-L-glutamate ligase RimK-like protein